MRMLNKRICEATEQEIHLVHKEGCNLIIDNAKNLDKVFLPTIIHQINLDTTEISSKQNESIMYWEITCIFEVDSTIQHTNADQQKARVKLVISKNSLETLEYFMEMYYDILDSIKSFWKENIDNVELSVRYFAEGTRLRINSVESFGTVLNPITPDWNNGVLDFRCFVKREYRNESNKLFWASELAHFNL